MLQVASIKNNRCETCQQNDAASHVPLSPRRVAESQKRGEKKGAECNAMQQQNRGDGLRHISAFLPRFEDNGEVADDK